MYTRESHDPHWRDKRLYYAMVSPTGYNRNATVQHSDFAFIGGNAMASWGYTNGACVPCHAMHAAALTPTVRVCVPCHARRRTHTWAHDVHCGCGALVVPLLSWCPR